MEYQKKKKILDNETNPPSKFRGKNWSEINDDARETYDTNSQINFKTSMRNLSLYDYTDAYIFVEGVIIVADTSIAAAAANNESEKVLFKNYTSFID